MKVLTNLVIVLFMNSGFSENSLNEVTVLRLKSVTCNSSNITVADYVCFIKAFSRTITTLNVKGTSLRPLNEFYV